MTDSSSTLEGWIGRQEVALDAAGRLHLPSQWRSGVTELVAIPWYPHEPFCIFLLSSQSWARLVAQLEELDSGEESVVNACRKLYEGVCHLTLDAAGRIRLPQHLLSMAGIERRALIIGVRKRLEVWSPEKYESHLKDNPPTADLFKALRF